MPGTPTSSSRGNVAADERKGSCPKCIHYFITHDAGFPFGCRAMNFKSKRNPQHEIVAATGSACLAFEAKVQQRRS